MLNRTRLSNCPTATPPAVPISEKVNRHPLARQGTGSFVPLRSIHTLHDQPNGERQLRDKAGYEDAGIEQLSAERGIEKVREAVDQVTSTGHRQQSADGPPQVARPEDHITCRRDSRQVRLNREVGHVADPLRLQEMTELVLVYGLQPRSHC
jgi:hypothetical protein